MRLEHISRRTEISSLHYIIDFIRFRDKRHPREMGAAEALDDLCLLHREAELAQEVVDLADSRALSTNADGATIASFAVCCPLLMSQGMPLSRHTCTWVPGLLSRYVSRYANRLRHFHRPFLERLYYYSLLCALHYSFQLILLRLGHFELIKRLLEVIHECLPLFLGDH
jgi:hypothetical protein